MRALRQQRQDGLASVAADDGHGDALRRNANDVSDKRVGAAAVEGGDAEEAVGVVAAGSGEDLARDRHGRVDGVCDDTRPGRWAHLRGRQAACRNTKKPAGMQSSAELGAGTTSPSTAGGEGGEGDNNLVSSGLEYAWVATSCGHEVSLSASQAPERFRPPPVCICRMIQCPYERVCLLGEGRGEAGDLSAAEVRLQERVCRQSVAWRM